MPDLAEPSPPLAPLPGVIGHQQVGAMLRRALSRDRLHHALIFLGPSGIGRRRLARGLAAALLCEQESGLGCGSCRGCDRALRGLHPDLRFLEGEGKSKMINAEGARNASLDLGRAPHEGRAHLLVIDPADRMHPTAANALLKTIEEPRPGVHLVLLAENPHDILPTIRSRCTTVTIRPLGRRDCESIVRTRLTELQMEIEDTRVELAVALSQGRPGVALELLVDPSLDASRRLLQQVLRTTQDPNRIGAVFGGDDSPLWSAWREAVQATPEQSAAPTEPETQPEVVVVRSGGKKSRKKTAKKKAARKSSARPKETPAQQRNALDRLCELWLMHLLASLRGEPGLEGLPPPSSDPERVRAQVEQVQELQRSIARNPNVRLALESTLLELQG